MKIRKKVILFFSNNLPMQIRTLKCSLNSLTLQFCRYDVSVLPTSVLNFGHLYVLVILVAICMNLKPLVFWDLFVFYFCFYFIIIQLNFLARIRWLI